MMHQDDGEENSRLDPFGGSTDFRTEILRRFDRVDSLAEARHTENVRRLESLEDSAKDMEPTMKILPALLEDWTGGNDPEQGMRRAMKQIIAERKALSIGWKIVLALALPIGTAIAAVWGYIWGHTK